MDTEQFKAYKDRAWAETRSYFAKLRDGQATRADDPQPALAQQFFEIYRDQSGTDVGQEALRHAFMMWGNVGSSEQVDCALATLDAHSPAWADVLSGAANAYARSGRREAFDRLLQALADELTHPRSRSAVYDALGFRALMSDRIADAAAYYRRVVELEADPFEVLQARGALYEIEALQPGQEAPHFHVQTIDGNAIHLLALRGRIVLLDFWATGCGPCWPELPHLRTLRGSYEDAVFFLIGISQDTSDQRLREVIQQERLDWPHIREPVTWSDRLPQLGTLGRLYNVWGIPRTVLIDRNGRIAAKNLRGEVLVEAVRKLTAQ